MGAAQRPILRAHPLLQRLKASLLKMADYAANVLPRATSHTCSRAVHGVDDSAERHAAYHCILLQQCCCLLLPSSHTPLLHSLLLVYSRPTNSTRLIFSHLVWISKEAPRKLCHSRQGPGRARDSTSVLLKCSETAASSGWASLAGKQK